MFRGIILWVKEWWKKHIADDVPKHLEDYEFSEKWRK
jgi:hypothetical protein